MDFVVVLLGWLWLAVVNAETIEDPILLVTEAWPPYVYEVNGQSQGFDWETSQHLLKVMGYQPTLKFLPWKRAVKMVEAGKAAALLGVIYTPERDAFMMYPKEHLSLTESTLFVKSREPFIYDSLASLAGLSIGIQSGYVYSKAFSESTLFKREPAGTMARNFQMLNLGRVDLVMANRYVGLHTLKQMGLTGIVPSEASVSSGKVYIAFSRAHRAVERVEEFDRRLKAFKTSEAYQAIMKKYLVQEEGRVNKLLPVNPD
ncbi:transporter substrate-binding domain-containing protein [Litoribacillus peritrichatus]|uniref:Transporter substrate-binding domain-containing protein n=2 Tax=Litoribacillus peritrichatus TaxID=718191 RepID=A0ABP7M916_9GAMM